MEESLLDQNITNCSLSNITTCTSINSSDNSSFTAVEDDRGKEIPSPGFLTFPGF